MAVLEVPNQSIEVPKNLNATLTVSNWAQWDNGMVELSLNVGKHVSASSCTISFTDDQVNVKLKDGRSWSCTLEHPIVRTDSIVKMKKKNLVLIMKKKHSNITWNYYEKLSIHNEVGNYQAKSTLHYGDGEVLNTSTVHNSVCNTVIDAGNNCIHLNSDECNNININTTTAANSNCNYSIDKISININCTTKEVISYNNDNNIKINYSPENINSSSENVKIMEDNLVNEMNKNHCNAEDDVISKSENVQIPNNENLLIDNTLNHEITSCSCNILSNNYINPNVNIVGTDNAELNNNANIDGTTFASHGRNIPNECLHLRINEMEGTTINQQSHKEIVENNTINPIISIHLKSFKTNFSETQDFLTAYIYIKYVNKSTCRVDYHLHSVDILFSTSDVRCHQLHEGSDERTTFKLHIDLIHEINGKSCTHRITPSSIELKLSKITHRKWGAFVDEDFTSSSSFISPDVECFNSSSPKLQSSNVSSSANKKPTCMVSPLPSQPTNQSPVQPPQQITHHVLPKQPIGFVGLNNMGNTCFINCVLQVLANTLELRNYFLSNEYRNDLNATNVLGMGGMLASAFADMMVALWKGKNESYCPSKIKALIGQKQSRFEGYLQHDAEEFMEFLLDGLHEDLNKVINKPYTSEHEDISMLDHKTASDISWNRHKLRNDSIIVDLFQGQYFSRVMCPACNKTSIAYDPFSVVQVPIPHMRRKVQVLFFNKNHHIKPTKYNLEVQLDGTVENLLSIFCKYNNNLQITDLRVMECDGSQFKAIYKSGSKLSASQLFIICEVYSSDLIGEPVVEVLVEQQVSTKTTSKTCSTCGKESDQLRRCTKCFKISYCNQVCQREDWPNHKLKCQNENVYVGCPFIISMASSQSTYQHFVDVAETVASYSVNVFHPPSSHPTVHPDGAGDRDTSMVMKDHNYHSNVPLDQEADDFSDQEPKQKLVRCVLGTPQVPPTRKHAPFVMKCASSKVNIKDQGNVLLKFPNHVILEWKSRHPDNVIVDTKSIECETIEIGKQSDSTIHLSDCLSLFTEPEVLDEGHTWHCPHCKCQRQALKQMLLYILPPILVIHIKRFAFNNFIYRQKIQDFVQFPIRGLDMSPYCVKEQCPTSVTSPLYDLYAVINHQGFLLGGHYTTFAQCYGDDLSEPVGWRLFDDSLVTPCNEDDVITNCAYVLFYKRKDVAACPPLSSDSIFSKISQGKPFFSDACSEATFSSSSLINTSSSSVNATSLTMLNHPTPSLSSSSSSSMITCPSDIQLDLLEDDNVEEVSYNKDDDISVDSYEEYDEILNSVKAHVMPGPSVTGHESVDGSKSHDKDVDMNEID